MGTAAKATPFPLVSGVSEDPHPGSPLAVGAVVLRLLAPSCLSPRRRSVIGRCGRGRGGGHRVGAALQGRLGLGSCPLGAQSSSTAWRRRCRGRAAFCPFPRRGLAAFPSAWRRPRQRQCPVTLPALHPKRVRRARRARATSRGVPSGRPFADVASRPAGALRRMERGLAERAGCGANAVSSPGQEVQPREPAPASSAAPSAKGLNT